MYRISNNSMAAELTEVNTIFGKYELGRILGRGAFAKVYHARNIETSEHFAIKCISKRKITSQGLVSQIKREISIMRRLRHPNIVMLYEVLATKTKIYLVMELVEGGELFAKLVKGRLKENVSRTYFQQLISAVRYCHSQGVFHRDLKPENILIDKDGNLKVSDFGLSAATDQIRQDGMLHTRCGTPAYVAPEILGKRGYDGGKVDLWACGVILYVLNAGYLPFTSENTVLMYKKIRAGEFRCPKWMSTELKRLLSRLLDPNPNRRITVDGILRNIWFKKDYKNEMEISEFVWHEEQYAKKDNVLNAFDIISFSSGFDLSGLLTDTSELSGERLISIETPIRTLERIEEAGKKENLRVTRKEWRLVLEGINGKLLGGIEINRLTKNLAVVEIRSTESMWRKKLSGLIYQRGSPSRTGNSVYQRGSPNRAGCDIYQRGSPSRAGCEMYQRGSPSSTRREILQRGSPSRL